MTRTDLSKEEMERGFLEDEIFYGFNSQFCKEHLDISPCNILGLIKELKNKIEQLEAAKDDFEARIAELEAKTAALEDK